MILDCNEIIPDRLWVGCYVRPQNVAHLKFMGITSVVNIQSDEDIKSSGVPLKRILKAYDEAGIELRRVATRDFDKGALAANLPQCVAEVEAALAPPWARVYLHCTAGINRSPTTAAAFLIRTKGLSAQEAYDYVSARRHCSPYLIVLEQYAESLKGSS